MDQEAAAAEVLPFDAESRGAIGAEADHGANDPVPGNVDRRKAKRWSRERIGTRPGYGGQLAGGDRPAGAGRGGPGSKPGRDLRGGAEDAAAGRQWQRLTAGRRDDRSWRQQIFYTSFLY